MRSWCVLNATMQKQLLHPKPPLTRMCTVHHQAHEDRNDARKLTPDERKEKKLAKLAGQAEGQVTVQVAVFHVLSLANSKLQWRVRVNAEVKFLYAWPDVMKETVMPAH